jgi:predicted porin
MNRITITAATAAIAALGLSAGAVQAQSNVTIYGVADAGLVRETGGAAGSVTNLSSGVAYGSRLGFKGKEDLGGGMAAFFVLENGLNIDNGSAAQGGLLFGRQAFVGLSSAAGSVTLGHQYSPYYKAMRDVGDPFCAGYAGRAGNIMVTNTRVDNMAQYASPTVMGLRAEVAVGFGEVAGSSDKNRALSSAAYYVQGPLTVTLAWHQLNNATATDQSHNAFAAVRYNFGPVDASLGYAENHGLAGARSDDTVLGVTLPLGGPHTLMASYIWHDDQGVSNKNARQLGVGYTYSLSKRTDLYAAWAHIVNRNGASFKVGNATDNGSGNGGVNLGLRHSF